MAVDGSLIFDTGVNTRGFERGIKNVKSQFGGLENAVKKLGSVVAVAFSTKAITDFAKSAIEASAEVNASISQFSQTFGELKSEASEAMGRVSEATGIVETRLRGAGTSIYAFAKTTGMESVEALEMMEEALLISADSSAYYDRSLEETTESLKSFLKGNYENDSALGLSCTETTRNTIANKMYGKSFQELSESQKQLALLQMVKDANALSGAMGQASREADNWENITGNLKETWKQFLGVISQPILQSAIPVIKQLTSSLAVLTEYARSFIGTFTSDGSEKLLESTSAIGNNIAESTANQEKFEQAINNTSKAEEKSLAGFDEINTISEKTHESSGTDSVTPNNAVIDVVTDKNQAEESASETVNRIKSLFETLRQPILLAWDINGQSLITSVKSAFQQIGNHIKSIGKSLVDVWTNGTGQRYVSNILILFTDIFKIIGDISNALTIAWNDNGTGTALIQSYFNRWNALLEVIHIFGEDLREVWNDGTGVEISTNIFKIYTNINNTVANLRQSLKSAWSENDTGKGIVQVIFDILSSVLGTVNSITASTSKWAENIDFSPLLESIRGLLESVEPLADNVGEGLEWFYDNVLLPLASWTIEDVLPSFIDLLSVAIDTLNTILETLEPLAEWLWEDFLEPIAEWTGGTIVSVIDGMATALTKISDWISSHKSEVQDFAVILVSLAGSLKISALIHTLISAFSAMGGVMGVVSGITTALSGVIGFLTSPITLVCLAIGAVIAVGVLLIKHWDEIKLFAQILWNKIVEIFGEVGEWFAEKFQKVYDKITEIFSGIGEWFNGRWELIKAVFEFSAEWFKTIFDNALQNIKNIWKSVKTWFSECWNDIKSVFSNVGNWFKEKFEDAWENIKSIFSGVGDWFGDRWTDIKTVFGNIGEWFSEKFQSAWDNITVIFDSVGNWFGNRWNDIKSAFGDVQGWFSENFQGAYNKITEIFGGMSGWFSNIWADVEDGAKIGINWIIDIFNGLIGGIESGINWMIDCINTLSFDIPAFVPEIGGTHVGFDISSVAMSRIPHLATGTVVPANYGEFLAVLGDNKREAEIVSPISAIKQAVAEVIAQSGGKQGDVVVNVSMFPNERAFQQYIIKANKSIQSRGGRVY